LPLHDNDGVALPTIEFAWVREILANAFGGVTFLSRPPADGVWQGDDGEAEREQMVVVEVLVEKIDRSWWKEFRGDLERRFRQKVVVVTATAVEVL
jgi:hypothetical protein